MIQEEKDLLFIDLSARLHYGVKVQTSLFENPTSIKGIAEDECWIYSDEDNYEWINIEKVKPYLRLMSSMTADELKELNEKYGNIAYFFIQEPPYYHGLQAQHSDIGSIEITEFSKIYDWLLAHHFDFRGLIEKGLALEVPEEMYKTE